MKALLSLALFSLTSTAAFALDCPVAKVNRADGSELAISLNVRRMAGTSLEIFDGQTEKGIVISLEANNGNLSLTVGQAASLPQLTITAPAPSQAGQYFQTNLTLGLGETLVIQCE